MPRRKRNSVPKGNRQAVHQAVGRFWSDRIKAATKAKTAYTETADDVVSFFKAQHDKLFKDPKIKKSFLDFEEQLAISVPKVAQARNSLGPHLYPVNPIRTVKPKTDSTVRLGLARVIEAYLNYTPSEAKLAKQARKAIDDSLLRGRGFMEVYYDDVKQVVTSRYQSSLDVLIDPDVDDLEDAEWIAIRSVTPLWRLKRATRDKDRWRLKELGKTENTIYEYRDEEENDSFAPTNEQVEVWRVYSKMGRGLRGFGFEGGFDSYKDDNDFVCLGIVEDHGVPIFERDWEVPLYLDKEWPVVCLDYVETIDTLWPVSLMGQVMSLQKGMDLITSLQLSSVKQRGRVLLLGDKKSEAAIQGRVKNGGPAEYLPVDLGPNERLADKFMVLNMGTISQELRLEREFYEREIETTTGVTPVVHGMSGATQERSATGSSLKAQASSTRISDLKFRTEEHAGGTARHEAIYAKLELTSEEVERCVRNSVVRLFWVRVELPGGAVMELGGDSEDPSEMLEQPALTLKDVAPMAATFFETMKEAVQATLALWDSFQQATDPRIVELKESLGEGQPHPENPEIMLPPEAISPAQVTVADVWRENASMTAEEMTRELDYSLATGSMATMDAARLQDLYETLVGQFLPVAMQVGDINAVNAVLAGYQDAFEVPEDKRIQPLQPPAPPPPPGGGQGGGQGEGAA